MGILPKLKRIDRAIQIFEKLWEKDKRFKLFIKGKLPEDLPWLKNRKAEMDYFTEVFDRMNDAPWKDHIIFDGHGDNVAEWLTNINFMLSTSDIESFHLAPMEGMASGATPIVFTWPGSDTIYPKEFIVDEVDEAVELILKLTEKDTGSGKNFLPIVEKYDKPNIIERLNELILNEVH
ncbi:glycosyltransferase [Oceanobacillus sp. 143]|nr:glycosyltransferase [Oceanobacillus sp. 143]